MNFCVGFPCWRCGLARKVMEFPRKTDGRLGVFVTFKLRGATYLDEE